ncbi:MAG: hypothetical protein C0616_02475 [Desulfuromonas sp.]|nr:MAG: hypothetical protein C0616_02475 [Desulfuromonas sp.]
MAFLKSLFGKKDPLVAMGKAVQQSNWAEAISYVDEIDPEQLAGEQREEFARMRMQAGDELAKYNLAEAEACRNAGDEERAAEHYQIALEVAGSDELRQQAQEALEAGSQGGQSAARAPASNCSTCQPQAKPLAPEEMDLPDDETRLELLLSGLSEELAEGYRNMPEEFISGLLLAHGGEEDRALETWEGMADGDRSGIYWLERGGAEARLDRNREAIASLEQAVEREPDLAPAWALLADLLRDEGDLKRARKRLTSMREAGITLGFTFGRLAQIEAGEGNSQQALELALQAIQHPDVDGDTMVLCAYLLEAAERLDEAEALLARLPGVGGCGGGGHVHPLLAEFWLRHDKELDRALEAFKGAIRQQPDNLRWNMRVAQTYLARGWKKEGLQDLKRLLQHPELPAQLREDGEAWLARYSD